VTGTPGGPWEEGTGPPPAPPPPASWPPAPATPPPGWPGYPAAGYPGYGQPPDPRRRFRMRAVVIAAVLGVLGGLALAVVAVVAVALVGDDLLAPNVVDGTHEGVDEASAPAVGDCLENGPRSVDLADRGEVVDCGESHGAEVIGVASMPDTQLPPGDTNVDFFADGACRLAFEDYVGADYDSSALFFGAVVPSSRAWEEGDRRVFCLLDSSGYRDGRGSARGSG
jgi:hypothetical protein